MLAESPPSLPLYVAAWIVSLCGLYAVNTVLEEASFANLTFALTTIGYAVSYTSRRQMLPPRNLQMAALVAFAAVCVVTLAGGPAQSTFAPVAAGDDRSKALAVFFGWMVTIGSFALTSDGYLLFMCVPSLALIGLVSTMPVDAPLVLVFVVFAGAAAFMMVHENFLQTRRAAPVQQPRRSGSLLAGQVALAGVCLAASAVAANVLATPLHVLGSYVSLSAGILPVTRTWRHTATSGRTLVQEGAERQVGLGPVRLSDQIILKVQTDHPGYLRGETYDVYTGRGWRNSSPRPSEVRAEDTVGPPRTLFLSTGFDSSTHVFRLAPDTLTFTRPGSQRVHQAVKVQGGVIGEVYAVSEPRTVTIGQIRLQTDGAGGVHLVNLIQSGTYTVESEVPTEDPSVLRSSPMQYPLIVRARYLMQPRRTPASIVNAARRIADPQRTAYDKVVALKEWLGGQCKYNLDAPAVPYGQDVAEFFMFQSRQGYCDSFATSLVLLCRAVGIPARVASGFTQGEKDAYTEDYLVRDRDRHMWTEVYFAGVGWVAFDATGDAEDITRRGDDAARGRGGILGFLFGRGILPPLALLALASMVGYVLHVEVLQRLRRARRGGADGLALPPTNLEIIETYEDACALLARRGLRRAPAQTPDEYCQALVATLPSQVAADALMRVTGLCVQFRYSGEVARPLDVEDARAALRDLRESLRGSPRRLGERTPSPAPEA